MGKDLSFPRTFLKTEQILSEADAQYFAEKIRLWQHDLLGPEGAYSCEEFPRNLYSRYNWLKTPLADWLVPSIQSTLEEMGRPKSFTSQCWATIYRKGEGITPHMHSSVEDVEDENRNFLSFTLFLDGPTNVGTMWQLEGSDKPYTHRPNTIGEWVWFENHLFHAAKKNPYGRERIILSADIYPTDIEAPHTNETQPDRFVFHDENAEGYWDKDDDPEESTCDPDFVPDPELIEHWIQMGIYREEDREYLLKGNPQQETWEEYCDKHSINPSDISTELTEDDVINPSRMTG